jgi:hypothetical protein
LDNNYVVISLSITHSMYIMCWNECYIQTPELSLHMCEKDEMITYDAIISHLYDFAFSSGYEWPNKCYKILQGCVASR